MKIRLPVILGLCLAVAAMMFLVVPPKREAVVRPSSEALRRNAERIGARYAAADAARHRLAFLKASVPTTAMTGIYPGTDHCRIPGQAGTVSDWVTGPDEVPELDELRDGFATGYNRFLSQHFPEQMSAQCRR
jgi:hypothetical protein